MSSDQHIAIAGAGPVGAVAALALQQRGFAVTIIDRIKPMPGPHGLGMDIRNVALSRGSRQLIESLITWPQQAGMFKTMHVWEQWGVNALNFDAAELGSDCLGWIAEVAPLLQALWQQLEANADIRVVLGDIQAVETDATGVMVTVAEETLHADFLFAADGARSAVRNLLEVATDIWPTGQSALTTVVETEHSHEHTAWQRFLVDGPLAFLPSKHEHYSSVVWSQSPASLETNLGLADDEFSHRVGAALENRLGRIVQVAQRLSFPLQQQLARSAQPRPRVLLIGDALRVVHPLAGLGVNLGLEDVSALLQRVDETTADLAPECFTKFARQRLLKSQLMLRIMAGLKTLYGQPAPLLSWIRNVGVGAVNQSDWLKRQIMIEALGGHEVLARKN
jgi:2-octaprenylphenol hydroxylase